MLSSYLCSKRRISSRARRTRNSKRYINGPRAEAHCRSARQNKHASMSKYSNIELSSDWREGSKALRPFPRYFEFREHSSPSRLASRARLVWPATKTCYGDIHHPIPSTTRLFLAPRLRNL